MNNEFNNISKNGVTDVLLIIAIIIGLIIIGLLSYKMFIYDNKNNDDNKNSGVVDKDKNDNVIDNKNGVTKELSAIYNNKKHSIKLVSESSSMELSIYIDNELIEKINSFSNNDIDAMVYVFDSKYLGILLNVSGSYNLIVFNNNKCIGKQNIIQKGQSLCKDNLCKNQLNIYENIKFENNKLSFWGINCITASDGKFVSSDKIRKFNLSIENDKVVIDTIETIEGYVSGAVC